MDLGNSPPNRPRTRNVDDVVDVDIDTTDTTSQKSVIHFIETSPHLDHAMKTNVLAYFCEQLLENPALRHDPIAFKRNVSAYIAGCFGPGTGGPDSPRDNCLVALAQVK